jgi:predicted transcriptional regulator
MASDLKTALGLLGPLEGRIMRHIWQRHSAADSFTVGDIHDVVGDLAYTTVMTTVARLADKGLLDVEDTRGRAYRYRCALTAQQFVARAGAGQVDEIIKRFGDVALVAFTRRLDGLGPDARRRLRRLGRL